MTDDIKEIRSRLESNESALASRRDERARLAKEKDEIHNKVLELQRQLKVMEAAEETFESKIWVVGTTIRETARVIEREQRELKRAEDERSIRTKLSQQGDLLDIFTSELEWRKDALSHQLTGAKQLAIAGRGILGDKRGLGKTLESIMWLDMINVQRSIIFVPKETASAFRKQFPRWAKHRPVFDITSKPAAEKTFILGILPQLDEWNLIVNIESWRQDPTFIPRLIKLGAQAIIIDEAHSIKDPKTYAFQGIKEVVYPEDERLAPKHVLSMTGTPFLNYPDEIWPLLYLVDRLAWPTKKAFQEDYLVQSPLTGKWKFDTVIDAEAKLIEQLGIRLVRRDREAAGVTIPPQEIVVHELEFNEELYPRQYKAYRQLEKTSALALSEMEDSKRIGVEGLALMTRLRQMIVFPMGIKMVDPDSKQVLFQCNIEESVKLDSAESLIGRLALMEDERVVVFSQFKSPLRELHRRLTGLGISAVVLDGSTPDAQREEIKADFDADQCGAGYRWQVVLANYRVAGQGLDFTGATQMVILDQEWNPGRNEQAYGRIDRMGQERETTVHILYTPETVDQDMQSLIDDKADTQDGFEAAVRAGINYLKEKVE